MDIIARIKNRQAGVQQNRHPRYKEEDDERAGWPAYQMVGGGRMDDFRLSTPVHTIHILLYVFILAVADFRRMEINCVCPYARREKLYAVLGGCFSYMPSGGHRATYKKVLKDSAVVKFPCIIYIYVFFQSRRTSFGPRKRWAEGEEFKRRRRRLRRVCILYARV